jgi:hypothetical protein
LRGQEIKRSRDPEFKKDSRGRELIERVTVEEKLKGNTE